MQEHYEVSVVKDAAQLKGFSREIERLESDLLEENVFYESWMLTAALDCLAVDDALIAIVHNQADGITGLFPFRLDARFRGLPIRVLRSWQHLYCFLCTPLVARRHAAHTLESLLAWVESGRAPARLIELTLVAADGPFWQRLMEQVRAGRGWRHHALSYERAAFQAAEGPEAGISRKHLKEIRRQERRLSEQGPLTYKALQPEEPIEPWIARFLELEASGWKGRERTALDSDEHSRRFFSRVAAAAGERSRIQLLAIELDGVPIAMKCNFLAKGVGYAFKIAYDEQYAKYSPGVLLEMFTMRHLVEHCPQVRWMDSCAISQHFMINRLWSGRRTVTNCLLASGGMPALVVRLLPWYQRIRAGLKSRASMPQPENN